MEPTLRQTIEHTTGIMLGKLTDELNTAFEAGYASGLAVGSRTGEQVWNGERT